MTTAVLEARTHEFDVEDVEYLRHGDKPLLARVYRPRGEGPFPALVECHGGAWCLSDRITEQLRHQAMASHGIVSIALDFRSGNEDPYPASVQDINYAVRWAKLNAPHAQDPAGPRRPLGPVERRASRDARRHAAARSALCRDPAAGRLARAGRERALRGDVVAGDQSVQPLPPRQARAGRRQSAGMAEGHHRRARTPIGAARPTWRRATRCWRSSAARRLQPRRRSGSRAAATCCTTTRTPSPASPATSRSASSRTTARPAARSRSNISTPERHAGHSPDLSQTGDMFERMVAFVHRHIKMD